MGTRESLLPWLYNFTSKDSKQINKWLRVGWGRVISVEGNQGSRGSKEKGSWVYRSQKAYSVELTSNLNEVTRGPGQRLKGTVSGDWKVCLPMFWATSDLGWSALLEAVSKSLLKEASSRHGMRALESWGILWIQFRTRWKNIGGFWAVGRSRVRWSLRINVTMPIESTGSCLHVSKHLILSYGL